MTDDDSRTVAECECTAVSFNPLGKRGVWIETDETPDDLRRRLAMGERAEIAAACGPRHGQALTMIDGKAVCFICHDHIRGDQ